MNEFAILSVTRIEPIVYCRVLNFNNKMVVSFTHSASGHSGCVSSF